MDYNFLTRIELGEELPPLVEYASMSLRTRLRRNKLWNVYRIETQDIGEVLVLYSFRHRYSKTSDTEGFPLDNICYARSHSLEVHLQNYSRFIPDGTSEMYDKANKVKV